MKIAPVTLFFLAPLIPLIAAQTKEADLPSQKNFHLFLLAGQSNMAGRGTLDEQAKLAHPRVLVLAAEGDWKPAVDPLHYDMAAAGAGLGKTFGEIIAENKPSVTVGLIPAACGGSPISTWSPGHFHRQTKSHPYDDAIDRARRAMQDGTLKAILWHQGERDSTDNLAPLYEERLRELITRFREDLDAPDIPFIIGQLGQFPEKPPTEARAIVDQAHRQIAGTMDNVYFVSAAGLTTHDGVHFDTPSLRTLGERYAIVYLEHLQSGSEK
jgi:hypothetical protein